MYKDDSKIYENIGNYYRIEDPLNFKYVAKYSTYSTDMFLEDISKGKYDIEGYPIKGPALYDYVSSIKNPYDISFVYSYPNRLIAYFGINQLNTIVDRIVNNLGSNRAIAITIDPVKDAKETDIPCLQFIQAIVRDKKLRLQCLFRSNDVYGGFPSNMLFLTYLQMLIIEEANRRLVRDTIEFGGIDYYCTSGHIYSTDIKAASKLNV